MIKKCEKNTQNSNSFHKQQKINECTICVLPVIARNLFIENCRGVSNDTENNLNFSFFLAEKNKIQPLCKSFQALHRCPLHFLSTFIYPLKCISMVFYLYSTLYFSMLLFDRCDSFNTHSYGEIHNIEYFKDAGFSTLSASKTINSLVLIYLSLWQCC